MVFILKQNMSGRGLDVEIWVSLAAVLQGGSNFVGLL